MPDIRTLLILIPALPLAAAVLTAIFGRSVLGRLAHWPAVLAIAASCAASGMLVLAIEKESKHERVVDLWTWATVRDARESPPLVSEGHRVPPGHHPAWMTKADVERWEQNPRPAFRVDVALRADPLTAIMLVTVTFISLLVTVYSIGYMHGDPGYARFFSYVSLFVFSMTMLVSVSNFLLLYVFWEAVGLCSYLLIGFWYQKPAAAAAGTKAFLVNRVGDFGFSLGVFLLWTTYGTLNFHDTVDAPGILGETLERWPHLYASGGVGTAICLLLMLGACGKSAQFPLHIWLPDAMEGPTPVSALIHAATMVTAGVYMVARCTPLFAQSVDAQVVVAVIGGGTALMAAIIALTQTDLKRILAYSTISQLGYMFLALSTGTVLGIGAAMFHLVTHAFFKALLFLGAGSVMHATGGVIDIRQLGGLRRRMPITHWTFLIGCLALAGIPPLAGFFSKDAILAAVAERGGAGNENYERLFYVLYAAGLFTAFLTAVYTFRAFFLTFYGQPRLDVQAQKHVHESPLSMTGPLVILALGALGVGWYFQSTGDFLAADGFLRQTQALTAIAEPLSASPHSHRVVAIIATLAAIAGVLLAALLYAGRRNWAAIIARGMTGLYALSRGKFFFDEIYGVLVVRPLEMLARTLAWIDNRVIDTLVDLMGDVPRLLGASLRPLHGGLVQFYALVMVLGLLLLLGALLL
jgi:NADH-quinone oxidoreductase subunit L